MSNILEGVKNALRGVGNEKSINGLPTSVLSGILNKQNGKIEDATGTIVELMHFGEREQTRLEAAKEVLHLHGARKDDGSNNSVINILVQNYEGNEDRERLNNIFNPKRIVEIESESL